jgi:hypothetical protein
MANYVKLEAELRIQIESKVGEINGFRQVKLEIENKDQSH